MIPNYVIHTYYRKVDLTDKSNILLKNGWDFLVHIVDDGFTFY